MTAASPEATSTGRQRNPYLIATATVNRLFRQLDSKGKGKVTKEDLLAFLEKAGKGKDHLTAEDLREALLGVGTYLQGDAPSTETLLRGFFASEIGSFREGPALGDVAPDFELPTADGKSKVKLSGLIGEKPVVLILGNYTCGPFRSLFTQIEDVKKRYGKEAEFLMVYVREAHPTDGWRMKSNDDAGVEIAQPLTDEERLGCGSEVRSGNRSHDAAARRWCGRQGRQRLQRDAGAALCAGSPGQGGL